MENKDIQYKTLVFKSEEIDVEDKREFTAIISDESIDRDNEVLLASGMNKKDFIKNGIILFNHNPNMPIGTATSLRRSGDGWKSTGRIAEGVQYAEDIWQLVKQGVLKAVSVGFQIIERRQPTTEDRKMFGKTVESVIAKWKLLEYSIVSVPSNQNALISAAKNMDIDVKSLLGDDFIEEEIIIEEAQEGIEAKDIEVEASETIETEDANFEKQIEEEIKMIQEDIDVDDETKEKLVEVIKTNKVDIKDIMFHFKEEIKKQIKKNRGILY